MVTRISFHLMVSYLDLLLLVPIGLAIWRGWKNGFVLEIFSMLALFVGIYMGIHLSDALSHFMRDKVDIKAEYLPVTSFLIVFILVMVGLFFLGRLITKQVKAGGAERWNQIGGAFFSLTKTLLILSMTFLFFNCLDASYKLLPEQQKTKSYLYGPIYNFSLFLLPSVEESDFYKKLEEKKMAPLLIEHASKAE